MTLALTEEKIEKVILKCQNLFSHPQITVMLCLILSLYYHCIDMSDILNCLGFSLSHDFARTRDRKVM